jgi:hypothetical protein
MSWQQEQIRGAKEQGSENVGYDATSFGNADEKVVKSKPRTYGKED